MARLRRETGESARKWTSRFEGLFKRTRAALHLADANIDADHVTGVQPVDPSCECCGTGNIWSNNKGSTIGNRYLFKDLVASFGAQWDDDAIRTCGRCRVTETYEWGC